MIKRIFLLIALRALVYGSGYAQGPALVNVTPPSPNVQAMQKYGDIPVSTYTGIPDISIPIYTAKFRDISIPISLSYHASGIKVAEEASQVGLGWVLDAGGQVSRNIIGGDDFIGSNYFTSGIMDFDAGQGPRNKVQQGCDLQMFNTTSTGNTTYDYDITSYIANLKEFQPDQYYYNFPRHSGKFVMTRTFQAIIQKQEPIQITCESPAGNSWEIKSEDGYVYDFALQETYTNPGSGTPHVCAWYLTKITSPTGNTATFNYTANPTVIQGLGTYSELRDDYQITTAPGMQGASPQPYQYGVTPSPVYTTQLLTSIDMPNCRVQFYYSGNRQDLAGDQRLDSVSVFVKLKGVLNTQPLATTALTYDYFNLNSADVDDHAFGGSSTGTIYSERLKLTKVQETGYYGGNTTSQPPYVFNYYEGDNYHTLPSKGSFARDHWGYYNGKLGHNTLIPSVQSVSSDYAIAFALGIQGPERDADSNYVGAFSLKSIQYPTGGTTQFQYQSNDFDEYNSEVNDNTYFASTPSVVPATMTYTYDAFAHQNETSDTLDLTNEYIDQQNTLGRITMNAAFRFASGGDCNWSPAPERAMYYAICDSSGDEIQRYDLADYIKCSGSTTSGCYTCGSGVFSINSTLTLQPGKYILKGVNTGAELDSLETIMVNFSWNKMVGSKPGGNTYTQNSTYYSIGGGQRILRITDQDSVNPAADKVRKYIYHYWADKAGTGTPQEYSFGRRMTKPEYAYFSADLVGYSAAVNGGCAYSSPFYTMHLLRGSDSNNPLNGSAAGAVVGYDQVTELFGENGEYGEKVYRFNNQPDIAFGYIEPFSGLGLPVRPPFGSTIPNPLNGTLVQETDYANTAGTIMKVRDIVNTYETVRASENYVYGLQYGNGNAVNLGDQCAALETQTCDGSSLMLSYVALPSEWQRLASSEQKDYNQGDSTSFLDAFTSYYYDNPAHMQVTRTVTTDSKGQIITSATQYPLDFPNPTATDAFTLGVAELQQSHVVNRPIEKHIDKTNADGSNPRTTNAYLTYFNASVPTENAIYRLEKASPVTGFAPASVSSAGLTSNPYYQPYLYFDQYDGNGNILQQHKVSDIPHSYIWDYSGSLLVAEVTNAQQSDIAYTSFESDGSGNWNLSSAATDMTTAITGTQSYNLSNGSISKGGLQTGSSYVVSYWSKNGSYSIGGATGTLRTGLSINGWTYYEHRVTTSSSTITISGSGNIDELRLYPSTAQMTTYTYSPLVGVTSQCDVGNKITYYEYDGLGRLQDIKDEDGNILKTYEYQYQAPIGSGTN